MTRDWTHPLLADVQELHAGRWGGGDPLTDARRDELLARVNAALAAWVPSSAPAWARYDDAVKALASEALAEWMR